MTPHDQKTLCTALAFVLAVLKQPDDAPSDRTTRIAQYAGQIEAFCVADSNSETLFTAAPDSVDDTDRMIERHIRELKQREETQLPEDRETLIQLHDRLRQRQARRSLREVYAFAAEARLADLVLDLMDEEVNGDGALLI